jgi:hypothetical protein
MYIRLISPALQPDVFTDLFFLKTIQRVRTIPRDTRLKDENKIGNRP